MLYHAVFETPLGWIGAVASERGLRRCTLPQQEPGACADELGGDFEIGVPAPERFSELAGLFERYFESGREAFANVDHRRGRRPRVPARGVAGLPFDSLRGDSLVQVARHARGQPGASRAAGQAMARNRLPIVVPCHRVIGADGSLRGYGSGTTRLDLKRRLLELERGVRRLGV